MSAVVSMAVGCSPRGAVNGQPPVVLFSFSQTPRAISHRLLTYVADCERSRAFGQLMAKMPGSRPLPIRAAYHPPNIIFGSPHEPMGPKPLLQLSLGDLSKLPTAEAVHAWAPESSWALTRCEILAHEIVEGATYRSLWERAQDGGHQDSTDWAELAVGATEAAHRAGAMAERIVRNSQRTRLGTDGKPYGRTGNCVIGRTIQIAIGNHTEVLAMAPNGISRIFYRSDSVPCGHISVPPP